MAMRRRGRPGDYLMTSDYDNCADYRSNLAKDYWGDYGPKNRLLLRNLQEISSPLNDPYPVKEYRGPSYEPTNACDFELFPNYIGNTLVPFNKNNNPLSTVLDFNPAIPDMSVGCTFIVQADPPFPADFLVTEGGDPITTEGGDNIVL